MFIVKEIETVKNIIKQSFHDYQLGTMLVPAKQSLGYVTAEDIYSTEELPMFDKSTVDGYAVIDSVTRYASASSPIPLKLLGESLMGTACTYQIDEETTVYVPTGGHIPLNTTAMVMIEDTEVLGNEILIQKAVSKWENILSKGSDIRRGELVLSKNTKITETVLGLLMAIGVQEVTVYKPLNVLVVSTGDEITDKKKLSIGEVRDINTYTVAALLSNYNVKVTNSVVITDDFELYYQTVKKGFEENDLVISSGGSSVGEKDYTSKVLEKLHAEILVHGMNIKPGKPTVVSKLEKKCFLGLPGHPTSAYIVLNELFPTLYHTIFHLDMLPVKPYIKGVLDTRVHSKSGRKLYQIVSVSYTDSVIVTPLFAKSGMIKSLSKAYGYIVINDNVEGVLAGETVKVYRFGD